MPRRPPILLLLTLACAGACAAVYAVAIGTGWGARADSVVLGWFTSLQGTRLDELGADVTRFVDPRPYVLLGGALVAVALARERLRHAVVAAAVMGGAAITSQLLKAMLAGPRPHDAPAGAQVAEAAWPSGHTTGALALALCLVLVAPGRLRPAAAAAGGAFAATVASAVMLLGFHYPSDVLGGALVATAWGTLGLAVLRAADARATAAPGLGPRAFLLPSAGLALAAAVAVALAVLARPAGAFDFARDHTTLCAAAIPVAAAGLVLMRSAAAVLRRDARAGATRG